MRNTAAARADYDRCTEFTADHGLDASGDSDVFGAAICPNCERANPLTGDPADFREQVIRCMGCTRVMILDATALVAFATEVAGGSESGSAWHAGTCTDCGSAVDRVCSVGDLELCHICLDARQAAGDQAVVEVAGDGE